jgi:uncharacterized protein YifE (UPF0438 family)
MKKNGFSDTLLTLKEKLILKKHLEHYRSLDSCSQKPKTKMERRFILVCRGELDPKTGIEIAYLKYRRIQAGETQAEIVRNDRKNRKANAVPIRPCQDELKKSLKKSQKFETRRNNLGSTAIAVRSFASFADASAFAKRMAQEHKTRVRLVRRTNEFVVEWTFSSDERPLAEYSMEGSPLGTTKTSPTDLRQQPGACSVETVADARLCIECGSSIPLARLEAVPTVCRCVACQSAFEKTHDTRPRINEGLAGTRDENKKMRGQIWGEMRNRGQGH